MQMRPLVRLCCRDATEMFGQNVANYNPRFKAAFQKINANESSNGHKKKRFNHLQSLDHFPWDLMGFLGWRDVVCTHSDISPAHIYNHDIKLQ